MTTWTICPDCGMSLGADHVRVWSTFHRVMLPCPRSKRPAGYLEASLATGDTTGFFPAPSPTVPRGHPGR